MRLKSNDRIKYSLALNGIYDPKLFGMNDFIELVLSKYPANKNFFPTVFRYLKESGITGMEFSFGPGTVQNVLDTFGSGKEFGKVLSGEGLELSSVFCTDLIFAAPTIADVDCIWKTKEKQDRVKEDLKRTAGTIVEAGCQFIPINPPIRRADTDRGDEEIMAELYSELGAITKAEGVQLLLHNESNSMVWSHEDVNRFLGMTDSSLIGLCPDIAHIRDCGGTPQDLLNEHLDDIPIMHWKDCVKQIPDDIPIVPNLFELHNEYYTHLGDGLIDFKACAEAVKKHNWSGWIVLEIPIGNGTSRIDQSIELMNQVL